MMPTNVNITEPVRAQLLSTGDIRTLLQKKQGMNANAEVPESVLDQFTDTSSWFWTYSLEPSPKALAWAKKNEKEFVPLVSLKRVLPKKYGKCSFIDGTC